MDIIRSEERFHRDVGWVESYSSFSFADYYEESNRSFGPLCVFNEDRIAGGRGFGAHPHREMEIVTVALGGRLKHEDSSGHTAVTTFGGVQRMSAGTGIVHSEMNPDETEESHLLQIWFHPETRKLPASYETTTFDIHKLRNNLLPVVSRNSGPGVAHIHQDATLYLSDLEEGAALVHRQEPGRLMYLFVIQGELTLPQEGYTLAAGDTARIRSRTELVLGGGSGGARLLLIDMTAAAAGGERAV
ncbi:pirin family protein [Paenibacillus beijingensis]|uniref:Pirin n=1 Tax=Paenibacillus beijingensis TaxID=1126833 RepID=A0A0D5NKL3_9BACL|nr:pirin family protein [Paenibacillus beijingensis]AJY75650.1 pirin [Paenibacillus beijingensis]